MIGPLLNCILAPAVASLASTVLHAAAGPVLGPLFGKNLALSQPFNPLRLKGGALVYAIANPGAVVGTGYRLVSGAVGGLANGIKGSLVKRRVGEFEGIAEAASQAAFASVSETMANPIYQEFGAQTAANAMGTIPLPPVVNVGNIKASVMKALHIPSQQDIFIGQMVTTLVMCSLFALGSKFFFRGIPPNPVANPTTSPNPSPPPTDGGIMGQAGMIISSYFIAVLPYLMTGIAFAALFYYIQARLDKMEKATGNTGTVIETTASPVPSNPPLQISAESLERQINELKAQIGRIKKK